MGPLEHVFDLRRGAGEHLGIGIRRRAGHVATVREQIRRAPEQPYARGLHPDRGLLEQSVQVRIGLAQRRALGSDVAVVETPVRHAEARDEIERGVELQLRGLHRLALFGPGPREHVLPEREDVFTAPAEAVPVADGRAQMFGERLAEHHALRVVPAIGQRIAAVRSFVTDRLDIREYSGHRQILFSRTTQHNMRSGR